MSNQPNSNAPVTLAQLQEELEQIRLQYARIQLHLLAISQAIGALPWQNKYKFEVSEPKHISSPYHIPMVNLAEVEDSYSAQDQLKPVGALHIFGLYR